MANLKHCPFCGSSSLRRETHLHSGDVGEYDVDVVECLACDAVAPETVWNSRGDTVAHGFIEFKKQLEQGLDPSFKMDVSGVVFEVRLVSIPGEFERNTVPFSGETND